MIRFSWVQFRVQAAVAAVALAAFAVILAATGPHLFHLYDTSGVATCQARADCVSLASSLVSRIPGFYTTMYFLGTGILFAVPLLIGAFWGAPLITREFETGTVRLAWTQGVTRGRWLTAKLAVVGLGAMATAGLFSLLLTWWAGPLDTATALKENNSITFIRLGFVLFATRDITPIGYAAFAFALGVTAGILIRRTIPAMAVTLAVFAAVQIAWPVWVRAHLITPAQTVVALTAADTANLAQGPGNTVMVNPPSLPRLSGSWILNFRTIEGAGHAFNVATVPACVARNANVGVCQAALGPLHLRDVIAYQPASRFWAFQWYETGIFVALAVALAGFCCWWIQRRRLS
ncbi:MAG TPA: ABC transporter permease subunit [Streptosporangiaceae bacterium]|nr:ABC transporter permease subunit [Streptosporangiaceae bacterium]